MENSSFLHFSLFIGELIASIPIDSNSAENPTFYTLTKLFITKISFALISLFGNLQAKRTKMAQKRNNGLQKIVLEFNFAMDRHFQADKITPPYYSIQPGI